MGNMSGLNNVTSNSSKIVIPSHFHYKYNYYHIYKFAEEEDELYLGNEHLDKYTGWGEHTFQVDEDDNTHIQNESYPNNMQGVHDTTYLEGDLWEKWDSDGIKVFEP